MLGSKLYFSHSILGVLSLLLVTRDCPSTSLTLGRTWRCEIPSIPLLNELLVTRLYSISSLHSGSKTSPPHARSTHLPAPPPPQGLVLDSPEISGKCAGLKTEVSVPGETPKDVADETLPSGPTVATNSLVIASDPRARMGCH